MVPPYPERAIERDRWILGRRPARAPMDPARSSEAFLEDERTREGDIVPVATLWLTNRECPWRCLMCDLWKHTLSHALPAGAIVTQINQALRRLHSARRVKLYNSGSFFDPRAIARAEYPAIAQALRGFPHVIVESHPRLVGEATLHFRDLLAGQLEVAMGLETAHPQVLAKLNKRMTLGQFQQAAEFLQHQAIDLRVFVLVGLPFLAEHEVLPWTQRSIEFAFDCGASVVSLIPTRFGNGALETLAERGEFRPPKLAELEAAAAYGVARRRGRVFADTWDIAPFAGCPKCLAKRVERLRGMNQHQQLLPVVECPACPRA